MIDRSLFNILSQKIKGELLKEPQIKELTSNADSSMLDDQVKHFLFFLLRSLSTNNSDVTLKMLPWMYHAFYSHGFKYQYFLFLYQLIEKISEETIDTNSFETLKRILKELESSHDELIETSKKFKSLDINIPEKFKNLETKFRNALLNADSLNAKDIFNTNVNSFEELSLFYNFVICPAMIEVGLAWEDGVITHEEEHLASAIVLEILTLQYTKIDLPKITKGKIIVSTVTNEFHEIGANMLANVFEADGWDVTYLGSDVSKEELISEIVQNKPNIVALSISMPFNLDVGEKIIKEIKEIDSTVKIIVGGNAFASMDIDEENYGADAYLKEIDQALNISNKWYK